MTAVAGRALALLRDWLPPNDDIDRPRMQLCTVDPLGRPDARTVLLSGWDAEGFVFHTDSASRKVADIGANPAVALVLLWPGVTRQLTVQGRAEPAGSDRDASAYAARSRSLQQLAWLNTAELARQPRDERVARWAAFEREHGMTPLAPPATWTGFLIRPHRLTFWRADTAGPSHRTEFRRAAGGWTVHPLAG